jgi:Ribosomal protein L31
LHPPFYEDTKVYYDVELVMVTSGTQKELNVDTWSGNHPFYLGQSMGYDDSAFFFYDEEEYETLGKLFFIFAMCLLFAICLMKCPFGLICLSFVLGFTLPAPVNVC